MSDYPPPLQFLPTFNQEEFIYYSSNLTYKNADSRYLKLTGGVERGLVSFNAGLSTSGILGISNSAASTSSITGALQCTGGAYFGNNSIFNTQLSIPVIRGTSTVQSVGNDLIISRGNGDSSGGSCTMLITPSVAGWSTSGNSQLYLGDSSHAIKVDFGVGMTIADVNEIRLSNVSNITNNNPLYVGANGKITTTNPSSRSIKSDIIYWSNKKVLDKINKISVCNYSFIEKSKYNQKINVGLIAEELNEIFPELVDRDEEDNIIGISTHNLIYYAIEAIKELTDEINLIKSNINIKL